MEPVDKQKKEGQAVKVKTQLQAEVDVLASVKKQKESSSFIKPLRTYQSDIAEALAKGKTSLVGIVSAEHKKKNEELKKKPPVKKKKVSHIIKNILMGTLSIIFVVAGVGYLAYFYIENKKTNEVLIQEENSSLIFSEKNKVLNITDFNRRKLMNALVSVKDKTGGTLNTVTNYIIIEKVKNIEGIEDRVPVGAESFLKTLEVRAPSSLLRALEKEFMFGVHVFDGNVPFFIFKVESYENAFAGMLAWEKTMEIDLYPLFKPEAVIFDGSKDGEGTTTPKTKLGFRDVIIKNKDTRVLEGENGETIFLYSFLDSKTIVMAANRDSFTEILTRIASSRNLR